MQKARDAHNFSIKREENTLIPGGFPGREAKRERTSAITPARFSPLVVGSLA